MLDLKTTPLSLSRIRHEGQSENRLEETTLTGKRLLIIFPHISAPGGALKYALRLAGFLADRGATVGILALRVDYAMFTTLPGVEILSLDGPLTSSLGYWAFLPFWQIRINSMISAWRPDLLIPQVFPANWWGWLYKRSHPGIKLVWVCQEPSAFIHSLPWIQALVPFWKRWLARLLRPLLAVVDINLSRHVDRIVANSLYTAGMVQKIYGRVADAVVYPGIEPKLLRPDIGELREGIITVARLTRFKRVDFLLRVFALVLVRYPDLVFNIVGRGEEESSLLALSEELGIRSKVIFHGSPDNETLALLYRRSLLFLHGSVEEPFGMAPLEAIACGTPVLAHRSGGPSEIIDNSCGRLIDSLSVESWSLEVCDLLSTLEGNKEYCNRVQFRASKFTWETTLAPIEPVITELLT
jgi:glycosyltransferase involved in cell wall biosynthesis